MPTLTQTTTNFTCIASNCGTLDISSTNMTVFFNYSIEFNVGGTTGNIVGNLTSNNRSLSIPCSKERLISNLNTRMPNKCSANNFEIEKIFRLMKNSTTECSNSYLVYELQLKDANLGSICGSSVNDIKTSS